MMTPRKIIVRQDGSVCEVTTPSLWALLLLQRGRSGYDMAADVAALRAGGLSEREIASAINPVKRDRAKEAAKIAANGRPAASHVAYMAWVDAYNTGGKTFQEALDIIVNKDVAWRAGVWAVLDPDDVPAERDFRGAWKLEAGAVTTALPIARELTKQRLRVERAPLLEALDVQYMRALEAADAQALTTIAAQKDILRNCTQAADTAMSLAALRLLSVG